MQPPLKDISLIMRPKAEHLYNMLFQKYLIDKAVLNVDSPRVSSLQISHERLERRRIRERIYSQQFEQDLGPLGERCAFQLLRILARLLCVDQFPAQRSISFVQSSIDSAMPSRIDSRIPGMPRRCRVSWMDRQSSSATRTAFPRLPVI